MGVLLSEYRRSKQEGSLRNGSAISTFSISSVKSEYPNDYDRYQDIMSFLLKSTIDKMSVKYGALLLNDFFISNFLQVHVAMRDLINAEIIRSAQLKRKLKSTAELTAEDALKALWSENIDFNNEESIKEELLKDLLDIIKEYCNHQRAFFDRELETMREDESASRTVSFYTCLPALRERSDNSDDDLDDDQVQTSVKRRTSDEPGQTELDYQAQVIAELQAKNNALQLQLQEAQNQLQITVDTNNALSSQHQALQADMDNVVATLRRVELENKRIKTDVEEIKLEADDNKLNVAAASSAYRVSPLSEALIIAQKEQEIAQLKSQLKAAQAVKFENFVGWLHTKFDGTNSTGIKKIIRKADEILANTSIIIEDSKFTQIAAELHQVAEKRVDSWWSKSHFFGKGRSEKVTSIYEKARDASFSLDDDAKRQAFINLLG